jgi:hypothetical protein
MKNNPRAVYNPAAAYVEVNGDVEASNVDDGPTDGIPLQ